MADDAHGDFRLGNPSRRTHSALLRAREARGQGHWYWCVYFFIYFLFPCIPPYYLNFFFWFSTLLSWISS